MPSPNDEQFHNNWEVLQSALEVDRTKIPPHDLRTDALPRIVGADLLELLVPVEWGETTAIRTITLPYRGEEQRPDDACEFASSYLVRSEVTPAEVIQAVERAMQKLQLPSDNSQPK